MTQQARLGKETTPLRGFVFRLGLPLIWFCDELTDLVDQRVRYAKPDLWRYVSLGIRTHAIHGLSDFGFRIDHFKQAKLREMARSPDLVVIPALPE